MSTIICRHLAEAIEALSAGIERSTRPEDRKMVTDYLAVLAPILAKATLGQDVLGKLPRVDRLFGNTWLIDQQPFEEGLAKWREFRREYERAAVGGMTVNERLYALGLAEDFDRAVRNRDREAAAELLRRAYVDAPSVQRTIQAL